jgi:hypothetical protein
LVAPSAAVGPMSKVAVIWVALTTATSLAGVY